MRDACGRSPTPPPDGVDFVIGANVGTHCRIGVHMRLRNWMALGFGIGLASACGGSVSLGDLGTSTGPNVPGGDAGGSDAPSDDATVACAATTDCGPAPKSAAIQCSDGSLGGNTGRCLKSATGCSWEIRTCPADVCFDASGALDPSLAKCASAADCVVVTYQEDCCGTQKATGVASAKKAQAEQCGKARAATFPLCDCATRPTLADDGSTDTNGAGVPGVTCSASGRCETSFKTVVCGTVTCKPGQTCCSGVPFPSPTCFDGMACPISERKHKKDIAYLSDDDRARLNDELLRFPLATYRYKSEGPEDRAHLGFIIDDVAPSPAVLQNGERVDMYGYQTMTVAALQVQARELAALRRELEELKTTCAVAGREHTSKKR
jgi:hypothetical protein